MSFPLDMCRLNVRRCCPLRAPTPSKAIEQSSAISRRSFQHDTRDMPECGRSPNSSCCELARQNLAKLQYFSETRHKKTHRWASYLSMSSRCA